MGKAGSKDTDKNRITAAEYLMNIHAYPVDQRFANSISTRIANLKPETVNEMKAWIKRVNEVIEAIKRANV